MPVAFLRALGGLILLAGGLLSQTVPALPSHFYAAGAGYQPGTAASSFVGWAATASLLTPKAGIYSFTEWDLTNASTAGSTVCPATATSVGKFCPSTSERTGAAVWLREFTIGKFKIETFLLFTGGVVTSGTATGASGAIGAAATEPLPWWKLIALEAWEYAGATVAVGSPKTYRIGIGRSWD